MRRLFPLILLFCVPAVAEVSIGGNLGLRLTRDTDRFADDRERVTTEFAVTAMPSFIIVQGVGAMELVPFGGVSARVTGTEQIDAAGETTDENNSTSYDIMLGAGLFFRLLQNRSFRFAPGPDMQLTYSDVENGQDSVSVSVGMQVNVDFMIAERLFIRMGPRLAEVRISRTEDTNPDTRITFFDIHSLWRPVLGFYVTL
jgi:hypothetical protein